MDNGTRFMITTCVVIILGGIWNSLPDMDPGYESTGRTSLSDHSGTGGQHPGDNYAVYRDGQFIWLIDGGWPDKILERDGKIQRQMTAWKAGGYPLPTYREATPDEKALWLRYFKPTGKGQSVWL